MSSGRALLSWLALCAVLAACEAPPAARTSQSGGAGYQATAGSAGFFDSGLGNAGSGGAPLAAAGASGMTGSGGTMASAGEGGSAGVGIGGAGGAIGGAGEGGVGGIGGTSGSGGTAGGGGDAGAGAPVFHVFLLLGQSNMAGYPKAEAADKLENPRIKVLGYDDCAGTGRQKDAWDVAAPPLHECWNGAIGPADYFAKTLIEELPEQDTIGLVPCAISGERIETFMKVGGEKYAWIVDRAQLAQQAGGVIEGILFHQGESNNGNPS